MDDREARGYYYSGLSLFRLEFDNDLNDAQVASYTRSSEFGLPPDQLFRKSAELGFVKALTARGMYAFDPDQPATAGRLWSEGARLGDEASHILLDSMRATSDLALIDLLIEGVVEWELLHTSRIRPLRRPVNFLVNSANDVGHREYARSIEDFLRNRLIEWSRPR